MDKYDCFEIRKKMDPHYEGKFLMGAYSMGIFCNVTCPRTPPEHPDESDFVVLHNIYEGFECGLVPCEDCEPDMYTGRIVLNFPVSSLVERAVRMIEAGYLNVHSVDELAGELRVSERYLRKVFLKETGLTPSRLAVYHRGTIAKRLLSETDIPVTDIAYISGFGSLRQFNQVMRDMYRSSPTEIRSGNHIRSGDGNRLYIEIESDFDFAGCLRVFKKYEIPGVMTIKEDSYARSFLINGMSGWFEVHEDKEYHRLVISVFAADKRCYVAVYYRVLRMFDMIIKRRIVEGIIGEESFGGYLADHALPRLWCWFDPYECTVYALLRREMDHEQVMQMLRAYTQRMGRKFKTENSEVNLIFPEKIRTGELDQRVLGMSGQTVRLIRTVESLIEQEKVYLTYYQSYSEFRRALEGIEEIEEQTIQYIAMHGLGLKDVPGLEGENDSDEWKDYLSYTSLIRSEIRQG